MIRQSHNLGFQLKMEIGRSAYLFNSRLRGSQLDFRIDSDKKLIANMEESNV